LCDIVWCLSVYTDDYNDMDITADMCRANEGTRQDFCDVLNLESVLLLLKYKTVEQLPPPPLPLSSSSDFVRSPRNSSKRTRIDSSLEKQSESTIQQLQMMKISAINFLNRMAVMRIGDGINDQCACSILHMLDLHIDKKDIPDINEAFDINFGKDSGWSLKKVLNGIQLLMTLSSSSSSSSVRVAPPLPSSHNMAILEFLNFITDNFY